MNTLELANFIAPYLAPARHIAVAANTPKAQDITSPATAAKLAVIEQRLSRPSKRTYYLGANGRVSQRKHLVGEIVATTRACNTDQARFLFSEDLEFIEAETDKHIPTPHIGKVTVWHCPDCGRDFLAPVNSIAYPGQDICPGRGCYSRSIRKETR